jgi:hypothetical protein
LLKKLIREELLMTQSFRRTALALALTALFASSGGAEPIRVTGRVLSRGNSGIAGARVELFPASKSHPDGKLAPPLASARLEKDGSFEIAAPESGLYVLRIHADGHRPQEISLTPLVENQGPSHVWLMPGSLPKTNEPQGIEESKRVTAVRPEPPRVITGKIVDSASRLPIAGALVWSGRPPASPPP